MLQPCLRWSYRAIRRAAVLDVKRLLVTETAGLAPQSLPRGYQLKPLTADQRAALGLPGALSTVGAPAPRASTRHEPDTVGITPDTVVKTPDTVGKTPDTEWASAQRCFAAFKNDRLAAYVFLASGRVPAAFNFSRTPHLGTSLQLPAGAVFVHTAFTFPEHRGRRLQAALLSAALGGSAVPALGGSVTHAFTTMDWTNEASRRAFAHLGFRSLGLIYRLGWSRVQATVYPRAVRRLGIRVAAGNQGIRVALG